MSVTMTTADALYSCELRMGDRVEELTEARLNKMNTTGDKCN